MDETIFLALLAVSVAAMIASAWMNNEKLLRTSIGVIVLLALLAARAVTSVTATIDLTKIIIG